MFHLTRQQQWAVGLTVGLLLTGWAVKAYRTAHPSQEFPRPTSTESHP